MARSEPAFLNFLVAIEDDIGSNSGMNLKALVGYALLELNHDASGIDRDI